MDLARIANPVRARASRLAADAAALWATPLGKILALALLLRLTGLGWGLPNADGWDDDGIAPRDFLPGVLQTYWPGQHYTYPPLHLIVLAIVSAPVWVVGLLRAPGLSPQDVVTTFIQVPTMTALAVIARFVSALLSLGLLWNVARIGEDLRGTSRAGAWVAAACGLNAIYTYYGQTTNLDGPYLFWGIWSLRWFVHAIVHRRPAVLRRALILAALAVATKDQAYALFLLSLPVALALWLALDARARPLLPAILKEAAIGTGIALVVLLFLDGAITNPSGFRDRVHFLLGTGSQDHAFYANTWQGRYFLVRDVAREFNQFYPYAFVPVAALGLVAAVRARPFAGGTDAAARRVAGLVPLLVALSFTIAFDLTARRSEHRFVLPQSVMFGIYAGVGLDALHGWVKSRSDSRLSWVFAAALAPLLGAALFACLAVDAAMLLDPRYEVEAWLRDHVTPGDRIEVYDNNVHLPRLPANAEIERVDVTPVTSRNPILGVKEVQDRFSNVEARRPRFIVVSSFWAWRYLVDPEYLKTIGHVASPTQVSLRQDQDSQAYFFALALGGLHYRLARDCRWSSTFWPRNDIHASTGQEVRIYERVP